MDDLASQLQQIESGTVAKGRAIAVMRAKGASWRQIAAAANRPHSTIRYWYRRYLETTTTDHHGEPTHDLHS